MKGRLTSHPILKSMFKNQLALYFNYYDLIIIKFDFAFADCYSLYFKCSPIWNKT